MKKNLPRNITPKTMVSVAIRQANGGRLVCPLCRDILWADEPRILEHTPARALLVANGETNPDQPKYLAWVHKHCAALKTRGCTGTSKKGSVAQGDTHRIRKAARIAEGGKVSKKPMRHPTLRKRLDGTVIRRET